MFKTIYGLGMTADRMRFLEQESKKAKELRLAKEAEEAKHNAFKEKIFSEHEHTSRISTASSQSAGRVRLKMSKTIRANRELVTVYDKAVESFENTAAKVLANEIQRIEDERLLAEAVKANHGVEDLDFFKSPDLETIKRT